MKKQKQTLSDDLHAQDSLLTAEADRMNRAGTGMKTTLMATLLTHLVEQRVTMDARKAAMDDEMMKHMMRHMAMSKESMTHCPMMNGPGIKGTDAKPEEKPASHKH